eukprot:c16583_g1_i1.p1 GENE.c16583_g1_i1~~c16583_g1_i1.p1  ORF type:complete len:237 (-),score=49.73 c16583_g1_i1:68-778(-)
MFAHPEEKAPLAADGDLSHLTAVDGVWVVQQPRLGLWDMNNRYDVFEFSRDDPETYKTQLFFAKENSSCMARAMMGPYRSTVLDLHKHDMTGPVNVRFFKSAGLDCFWPCFPFCGRANMEVISGSSDSLGFILNPFTCCQSVYQVVDLDDKVEFTIAGPSCQSALCCPCCCVYQLDIQVDGESVGHFRKHFTVQECFSNANKFQVLFPAQATPQQKALLLGAVFLIDFTIFERRGR